MKRRCVKIKATKDHLKPCFPMSRAMLGRTSRVWWTWSASRRRTPASYTTRSTPTTFSGSSFSKAQRNERSISRFFFLKTRKESYLISPCVRHVAVGWGVVEDTLKAEVERRKENVGKRVTKVNPRNGAVMGKNFKMWKNVSVTDGLPAKRIEKYNSSEKRNC